MNDKNGNPIQPGQCYVELAYYGENLTEEYGQLWIAEECNNEILFVESQYECDKWVDPDVQDGQNAKSLATILVPA